MFYFKEVFMLLWCVTLSQASCSNAAICVASGKESEAECQQHHIIHSLSDLTINVTNCATVHIYLTSGIHVLNKNLSFSDSVEETKFLGALHGQPSIIECENAGIRFNENTFANKVFLSNIIFVHCQTVAIDYVRNRESSATLYFRYVSYTLNNVSIINNTEGYGLYAESCNEQFIFNCIFNNNDNGAAIYYSNNAYNILQNSTFNNNKHSGLILSDSYSEITAAGCTFANNHIGLLLDLYYTSIKLRDCIVHNNTGTGAVITSEYNDILIAKVTFYNNSRALDLLFSSGNKAIITECNFIKHQNSLEKAIVIIKSSTFLEDSTSVTLKKSTFKGNGLHGDCSVLLIENGTPTISDVNIADNSCTGITLSDSTMYIQNTFNLTRNHGLKGGGLSLSVSSELSIMNSSSLNIINNTAVTYGGGIYSDRTCENSRDCFFQFELGDASTGHGVITFSGNSAGNGGDIVLGSCLSECSLTFSVYRGQTFTVPLMANNLSNIFWDLVSSKNIQSISTFAEYPKRVSFCSNTSTPLYSATCTDSYTVSVYRGQTFSVPLMAGDEFCVPSIEVIEAQISQTESTLQFKHDVYQKSRKYCHNFSYTLTGGLKLTTARIVFSLQRQLASNVPPGILTVQLKECPIGYEINAGECYCQDMLKSYEIQCYSDSYSLGIPSLTWVGELSNQSGSIVLSKHCQYCNDEGIRTIAKITDSDKLCIANRTGVMCGACIEGYSLQLGGNECAECSNSTHKGVILFITFAIVGIALVLLLLGLDLTVSTGLINGLIFYSNIVYLNSDSLLPITREGNSTHLQNMIKFLSTFQAWMNLDFGIVTCFFDGYDTYISTWMQFVFPLYIWLLILIIVLASRYSNRISKITTSNTVSVLATLLLLAYTKLLKTSIETFSSVQLKLIDQRKVSHGRIVWKPDPNIPYMSGLHVPLFLMSLVMVMVYVIPFTLLILLGPLLQAKSHHSLLNWINRLKPFLDAFYGPYTSRYRYWPGILLLVRLVTFAFYFPNDTPFNLTAVSVVAAVLFAIWLAIGKTHTVSLYQKRHLSYLDLFLLLNLGIFSVASAYTTESTEGLKRQQGLAVAMVGSVLAVFCVILAYRVFCAASRYRAMRKIIGFVATRMNRQDSAEKNPAQETEDNSVKTTHSLVEMAECGTPNDELREPLLTNLEES